jgi:protein SCO1
MSEATPSGSADPKPDQAGAAKAPVWKNPWLIAFVVGATVLTVLPAIQSLSYRAPPPLHSLGDWSLVDQEGKAYGSAELKGKVWIGSFFFTRCPTICTKQQMDMAKLLPHLEDLGESVQLVSFTVDPSFDTPEVLTSYAKKIGAPQERWHYLGGDEAKIRKVLVNGIKVAMGERRTLDGSDSLFDISHSAKLVLVDQNGDVRGFWSSDDQGRSNMTNAARMLAKRGPEP